MLKKGDRFYHKRILMPDYSTDRPLKCVVTKIARGHVYWRADYGLHDDGTPWLGSGACFPIGEENRWVGEVIK